MMNIHKRTRLLPYEREQIWELHSQQRNSVAFLAEFYNVSRPTVYKVLKRARLREFISRDSSKKIPMFELWNQTPRQDRVHYRSQIKGKSASV